MLLIPSQINFSQDSIRNTFYNGDLIGETLDDLCTGRCLLSSFPKIYVADYNFEWFTMDNRRLWVFRHLYRLGKCGEIPVEVVSDIDPAKMTTTNGGSSITVRGDPGGIWHLYPDGFGASRDGSYFCTWPEDYTSPELEKILNLIRKMKSK